MELDRALKRIESMADEIERRISALPPLVRGRTSLWADLEALSIAKSAICKEIERENQAKNQKTAKITPNAVSE